MQLIGWKQPGEVGAKVTGWPRVKIQHAALIFSDGSSVEPMGGDGVVRHQQVMAYAASAVGSVTYPILDPVLVRYRARVSRSVPKDLIDAWDRAEFAQIAPSQTSARVRAAATASGQKDPMVTAAGEL